MLNTFCLWIRRPHGIELGNKQNWSSNKILLYWCIRPTYTFGLVCQTAMTNHSMNKPTDQRRGSHTKRNNTRDAKDQAWERNPSGKPTNEERARKTGLFQYQDCWSKDRDSWPFLSTPPSPPTPLLTPPPLCTEPWVASKLTPGPGKEEGGRGGEGGEVSPGQQQRVSC